MISYPQASSDQTNVDLFLPFFVWMSVSMYITVISVLIVTCQVAWPSVVAIIPLVILNLWYRVSLCSAAMATTLSLMLSLCFSLHLLRPAGLDDPV